MGSSHPGLSPPPWRTHRGLVMCPPLSYSTLLEKSLLSHLRSPSHRPHFPHAPHSSTGQDPTPHDLAAQRRAGTCPRPPSMSLVQVPTAAVRPPGPVLLSAARGRRPSGIAGAPDTVACGSSPLDVRQARHSPEIIRTGFWPVIDYNITARPAHSCGDSEAGSAEAGTAGGAGVVQETQGFLSDPFLGGIHTAEMSRPLLDGHWLAHGGTEW